MALFKNIIGLIFLLLMQVSCSSDDNATPSLSAPLALNPSDITQNSFVANWAGVKDAQSYVLDVSSDIDFTSFVEGYQALSVNGIYTVVDNLSPSTSYYYRVRAVNGTAESSNSMVISLTTEIPDGSVLKELTQDFFIGTIVQSNRMTGMHHEVINREFSSITAEYEMKMNIMYPSEGVYDWTASDAIVNYAVENKLNIHGHALVWHNATPNWVENFSGTDAEFETMLEEYVKTVVTRYKGKITSWDVVNEAFNDGSGTYRNSVFYQRMGASFISKCFQWAREADPDVLLFYNDYNMCSDQTKRDAVFTMVDDLISNSVAIDGVGYQMHIAYNWPAKKDIQDATQDILDRNLKVHYAELDIRANPNNDQSTLTDARSLELKAKYKEIAELYTALPTVNKYALTIWGLKDNESWLLDFHGQIDWPLLYNNNFEEKDAYYGVLEGLVK
ncbi:endo-1,4-beta-xylanase [Saccharicrinis aurantiacus]|uniref:endo-1,4-beta-xylanase n=1 Tax=Saccharicrinis aurantiacus TaxID=1849719 RepID=UPI0024935C29|nr:endo-1,4-beta-xylanase [Saccharicrinis aurantiacus]